MLRRDVLEVCAGGLVGLAAWLIWPEHYWTVFAFLFVTVVFWGIGLTAYMLWDEMERGA